MRALIDDRPATACATGVGRYSRSLAELCSLAGHQVLTASSLGLAFGSPAEEELDLPAQLLREGIDLYHSPLWGLPALLPYRAVVTVHDAIPATHPELTSEAFRPVWTRAAEDAARAAAVVCPTDHARNEVVRALGLDAARVHVVPEAPAAIFSPRSPETVAAVLRELRLEGPYLLAVGSLERRKNPDGLLAALACVPTEKRPLLVFAGPAAGFDVAPEAERRGVTQHVRHLGLVSDEALAALYSGALAVLVCSRAEGFGLPVVEAWACGAPVIASNVTALPEIAGEAALLVDPERPEEIAHAITRLIEEPGLAGTLRARGRVRLDERFSPATVRRALQRLYDHLEREREAGA